jgi:DDE superfamily endonuclease
MVWNGLLGVLSLRPMTKRRGVIEFWFLDGHSSHVTVEFIDHCRKHQIILLRLPPHTSHLCQPLDVGLFGPLKRALSSKLQPLIRTEVSRIRKSEWLMAFIQARKNAFTGSNVLGGWRGAGLLPFNPEKVLRHIEIPRPPKEPNSVVLFQSPPITTILQLTPPCLTLHF